jgi:hypothetical protein
VHLKEGSASGLRHGDGPGINDEAIGADQRSGQPNKIGKAWNDMQYAFFIHEEVKIVANLCRRHGNEGGR